MAKVVRWESLLLRRAASQQQRAAKSMRDLASSYSEFSYRLNAACSAARDTVARSSARTERIAAEGAAERARSLAALEGGDMAEMIAERDRLLGKN
jgi:hypothetical protein